MTIPRVTELIPLTKKSYLLNILISHLVSWSDQPGFTVLGDNFARKTSVLNFIQQTNMSTKVISDYKLRSRTRAAKSTATTGGESPVPSPKKTNLGDRSLSDSEVYTRVTDADRRTYRDVVHTSVTAANQREVRDNSASRGMRAQPEPPVSKEGSKLSSLESSDEDEDAERPWTVVSKGRKNKSKNRPVNSTPVPSTGHKELTPDPVIAEAEQQLTTDEKRRIQNRYKRVNEKPEVESASESEPSSKGEGPSKGKGVDPGNWGAANLAPEEMDLGVQEAAFASYKVVKELLNKDNTTKEQDVPEVVSDEKRTKRKAKHDKKNHAQKEHVRSEDSEGNEESVRKNKDRVSSKLTPMSETVAGRVADMVKEKMGRKAALNPTNKPVNQITINSYLGRALEEVRERSAMQDTPVPSSGSSSSSSSSSNDSETGSEDSGKKHRSKVRSRQRLHAKRNKHARKHSRSSSLEHSMIKPKPPKDYDGVADARSFHRFVTEGTDYVMAGKVSRQRHVFVLSYHLKGKAYDFYTQEIVTKGAYNWSLEDFFKAMFNYCFPIDYWERQRERLRKAFQNGRSVSEYSYEIEEICNMIGLIDEREKVSTFWHGLRQSIQCALWRDRYNPETSSWAEVKDAAQIIEVSERVGSDSHENRPN